MLPLLGLPLGMPLMFLALHPKRFDTSRASFQHGPPKKTTTHQQLPSIPRNTFGPLIETWMQIFSFKKTYWWLTERVLKGPGQRCEKLRRATARDGTACPQN